MKKSFFSYRPFILIGYMAIAITACSTTKKHHVQDKKEIAYNTNQRVGKPKNFGIYNKKQIDQRWLRRGQRSMTTQALE